MITEGFAFIVTMLSGAMLLIIASKLVKSLQDSRPPRYTSSISNSADLPSVTVCIPARNERHALTECLEHVLASTYEKLEIIVLDDVSGDDTSALIKSFASSGVRFVKGSPLPHDWLGKNHALQGLLKEASGSYIVFLDVDTRLSPYAIENMVRYSLAKGVSMLSVIPRREDGIRASVLFSPLRYYWELLLNRSDEPAAISNAWMVQRSIVTDTFNGFNALKLAIQPESVIAKELSKQNKYALLLSDSHFGVRYEKKWRSQLLTSIRLLYPILGSKPLISLAVAADIAIVVSPWVIALSGLWAGWGMLQLVAGAIAFGYSILYMYYAHHVWRRGWLLAGILWPIVVVQELALLVTSLIQYKRKTVTWKGRPIRLED